MDCDWCGAEAHGNYGMEFTGIGKAELCDKCGTGYRPTISELRARMLQKTGTADVPPPVPWTGCGGELTAGSGSTSTSDQGSKPDEAADAASLADASPTPSPAEARAAGEGAADGLAVCDELTQVAQEMGMYNQPGEADVGQNLSGSVRNGVQDVGEKPNSGTQGIRAGTGGEVKVLRLQHVPDVRRQGTGGARASRNGAGLGRADHQVQATAGVNPSANLGLFERPQLAADERVSKKAKEKLTRPDETPHGAAEKAIAKAGANADPEWAMAALAAIRTVAERAELFTADDVWPLLPDEVVKTHDGRALGAMFQAAKRKGVCAATEDFKPCNRVKRHASPVRIWKSLVFRSA